MYFKNNEVFSTRNYYRASNAYNVFQDIKLKVKFTLERSRRPIGEKMYSSTLSLTSALDGVGWSRSRSGPFTCGKDPVAILLEAG